jgi:NADH dehydrogenase/NADH:ubiquinone oxidoreductase subunit G
MAKINIKINGQAMAVDEGMTILQAAQSAGIYIPTLRVGI